MKTITLEALREQQRQRRYARRRCCSKGCPSSSVIVSFLVFAIVLSMTSNYLVTSGLYRQRVLLSTNSDNHYHNINDRRNLSNNRKQPPRKNFRIHQNGKDGSLRITQEQPNDLWKDFKEKDAEKKQRLKEIKEQEER